MQRYLIHTSEKLVELWKVLWIPKRFVAEGLEILLYNIVVQHEAQVKVVSFVS